MHVRRTDRFDDEAQAFALRFTCEDCGHFDRSREQCRHGWPTALHRRAHYEATSPRAEEIVFCKEFDLD